MSGDFTYEGEFLTFLEKTRRCVSRLALFPDGHHGLSWSDWPWTELPAHLFLHFTSLAQCILSLLSLGLIYVP